MNLSLARECLEKTDDLASEFDQPFMKKTEIAVEGEQGEQTRDLLAAVSQRPPAAGEVCPPTTWPLVANGDR